MDDARHGRAFFPIHTFCGFFGGGVASRRSVAALVATIGGYGRP